MADRSLTPDQLAAVDCSSRVCFVVAPAGSGKTEVLIRRVIRLLNESKGDSYRVLAVTFTLKAADELKQRAAHTVGEEQWRVDADTIHGFSLDWLRRFGQPVGVGPDVVTYAERSDRAELLTRYVQSLGERVPDSETLITILDRIDRMRTDMVLVDEAPDTFVGGTDLRLRDLYEAYSVALDEAGGIDFPGMLTKFVELIDIDPGVVHRFRRAYKHVLVDEGQDLTRVQAELLRRLVGDKLALFVVADPGQSINAWAGGGIEWARLLVGNEAHKLSLRNNFRCATEVLDLAGRVAEHSNRSRPEALPPEGAPRGSVSVRSAEDEAVEAGIVLDWIDQLLTNGLDQETIIEGESPAVEAEEIGVIARTRFALDHVVSELTTGGHEVSVVGEAGSLLTSSEARLMYRLLEVLDNPAARPAMRLVADEVANLLPEATDAVDTDEGRIDWDLLRTAASDTPIAQLLDGVEELVQTQNLDQFESLLVQAPITTPGWNEDTDNLKKWWRSYSASTRTQSRSLDGFLRHVFRVRRTRPDDPGIRLLTTHRAKGLEFKAVAVVGLAQGTFPDYRSLDSREALDEERRAFYVAVTRAARALLLTWPRTRQSRYGRSFVNEPSQFLDEAGVFHAT